MSKKLLVVLALVLVAGFVSTASAGWLLNGNSVKVPAM